MLSRRHLVLASAVALASAGCSGAAPPTLASSATAALADADTRLRGAWKLQSFRPETPLEPMLQAFVSFQYQNLTVRLQRGRLLAESPGVHLDRAYRLHDAFGDRFKLTSYDEQGVPYEAVCTFVGPDLLEVNSWTEPWRGVAVFQKMSTLENVVGPIPRSP